MSLTFGFFEYPAPRRDAAQRVWTPERVELLKALQYKGFSCRQIAVEMGGGLTRNAVIGKLTRLGLAPGREVGVKLLRIARGSPATSTRTKTRRDHMDNMNFAKRAQGNREQGSRQSRARRESGAAQLRERFALVEIVDLPPDESSVAIPLFKLNSHTCRWPLGDPRDLDAMLFCGAEPYSKPDHDYPYCARHCRMAYMPVAKKQPQAAQC